VLSAISDAEQDGAEQKRLIVRGRPSKTSAADPKADAQTLQSSHS
jgi:hypothetical protein